MVKDVFKKYGHIILIFTFLVAIYLVLNNIPSINIFMNKLFSVLSPFLLGLLFALLLLAPCKSLENGFSKSKIAFLKNHKRGISIVICYLIVFWVLAFFIKFAIPTISVNISEFVANIPTFYNHLSEMVNNIPEDSVFHGIDFSFIFDNISVENIQAYFNFETIWSYVKGVMNFASAIFSLFVAIILSVYILLDKDKIYRFTSRFLKALFGERVEKSVITYINKLTIIFSKFINAQFIDAVLIGTLSTILLILIDVKYALILGPLIGIANMIPYFGAIFATIFAIVITLFTGGFWKAFTVFICILILQQIDANIINPKIMSNNLKISPLLVILAVTVGGGFFGVIGMFLGVPIMAIVKAIITDYINYKEQSKIEQNIEE